MREYSYRLFRKYLEEEKQEFIELTENWFNKVVGDYWFLDELVGVLKDE